MKYTGRLALWSLVVLMWVAVYLALPAQAQPRVPVRAWLSYSFETKLALLKGFIDHARQDNVRMELPAEYYVREVDSLVKNSIANNDTAGLDTTPLGLAIHTIAAMEGDWGNGENKCDHARTLMGPDVFEQFKVMYPAKYDRLCVRSP